MAEVSPVVALLVEQRKRALASILNGAESSAWWGRLSQQERLEFREKVVSSLGIFYDFVRDVVKVTDNDSTRNEVALDLLRDIHRKVLTSGGETT